MAEEKKTENKEDFIDENQQDVQEAKDEEMVELTKDEYNKLKEKADDAENLTKRIKADFDNYKKANEREKEQYKKYAVANMVEKLLPVLDTFDQALNTIKSEEEKKGLGLVYSQLLDILEKEGLVPIECVNQPFDPYKHEILMQEESDVDDDIILEEFQRGFMFKDKVLRYSKVKVAKKRKEKDENVQGDGDNE
ncbi:MAG: nucleotide exchange factor GrpE [Nanobdellota archaeon]